PHFDSSGCRLRFYREEPDLMRTELRADVKAMMERGIIEQWRSVERKTGLSQKCTGEVIRLNHLSGILTICPSGSMRKQCRVSEVNSIEPFRSLRKQWAMPL